jgi:large subunit ribosomal protein L18
MIKKLSKNEKRKKRHLRMRNKVVGTPGMPRLNVFRSSKNIYAQVIDDAEGITLVSASSLENDSSENMVNGGNKEGAREVGKMVAKKALEKGIVSVVFDRGGYIYHGRVKELADGAREAGLKF